MQYCMKAPHLEALWVILLVVLLYVETVCSQPVGYRSLPTCSAVHAACTSCSVATTTAGQVILCSACAGPSYVVSHNQRTCDCAPGYYLSTSPTAVAACVLCPKGSFCPGGPKQTATSSSCGPGFTTITTGAMTAASCIAMPGMAFMRGPGTAKPCGMGTYNDGWNKRNCTRCPVGMSTASTGASSFGSCLALPGWFYQNRIALPCAQGTYKPSLGQAVKCLKCPAGSTTHSIRHTAAAHCSVPQPGYQVSWGDDDEIPVVERCPHSSYSPGYSTQPCRPCPMGLTTPSTGSTTVSDCSVPPGHGFYCSTGHPAGSGPVTNSMLQQLGSPCVVPCPKGSYKAGWGRAPCASCGVNFRSPDQATSAQQCYIPAGWGSKHSWKEGGLVATKCMHGLYGASQPVYGTTGKRPCHPCPQHTVTPDMLPAVTVLQGQLAAAALEAIILTSAQQCLTVPGYGWQAGRATRCGFGFYAPGYSREPCTACGPGMTTEAMGSQAKAACVALPGWELTGVGTAEPCPSGNWSSGGMTKCKACYKSLTVELTSTMEESSATTESITLEDISWSDGLSELEAAAAKPHRGEQCIMT